MGERIQTTYMSFEKMMSVLVSLNLITLKERNLLNKNSKRDDPNKIKSRSTLHNIRETTVSVNIPIDEIKAKLVEEDDFSNYASIL